jgi:hypothetical protein
MSERVLSKGRIFAGLLFLALLGAGALGYRLIYNPPPVQAAVAITPAPHQTAVIDADQAARTAALAGVHAFYTVDYRNGQQAWLDQLCAASTLMGCTIDRNAFVPALWPQLAAAKTVTTVAAEAQEKVVEQVSPLGNVPLQVWRLHVQLSAPWPGQTKPVTSFQALALVMREKGTWKFERFLTEDEALALNKKDTR